MSYKMLELFVLILSSIITLQTVYVSSFPNGQESNGTVTLPLRTLMSISQECPRLQEMGSKLLNDREFCDVNLEVVDPNTGEKRIFCAHKCILCLRSDVLKQKIRQIVSVGTAKPALKLPSMNTEVFRNVLTFIYTDKIDSYFDLRHNIMDLYYIADFLGLPDLKVMIEEYFYGNVHMQDIGNYLQWAKKNKFIKIEKFILDFARNTFKMSRTDWTLFVQNICVSAGYTQEESDQLLNEIGTDQD